MSKRCFVGWDIGGAHLKYICLSENGAVMQARQLAAPVWRGLDMLHTAWSTALSELPVREQIHAVTMTAELADCFPDRNTGVKTLLDTAERFLGSDIRVYRPQGLCDLAVARTAPVTVASANWHAGAAVAGRWYDSAVLVDIGSTTTDVIAIRDGRPAVRGYTDRERMQAGELLYTGVVRTPVVALASHAPVAGTEQHLATEQFANMADVYRLTGELPAGADQMPTADGGPRDRISSARRLARMACADLESARMEDWQTLAVYLRDRQLELIQGALMNILTQHDLNNDMIIIGAGCGRFLVPLLADRLHQPCVDITSCIRAGRELKQTAADMLPAYAMAEMARAAQPVT